MHRLQHSGLHFSGRILKAVLRSHKQAIQFSNLPLYRRRRVVERLRNLFSLMLGEPRDLLRRGGDGRSHRARFNRHFFKGIFRLSADLLDGILDRANRHLHLVDNRSGSGYQRFRFGLNRRRDARQLLYRSIDEHEHRRLHDEAQNDDYSRHRHDDVKVLLIHELSLLTQTGSTTRERRHNACIQEMQTPAAPAGGANIFRTGLRTTSKPQYNGGSTRMLVCTSERD